MNHETTPDTTTSDSYTPDQINRILDRAAGTLLGCAAGDALGAGYEFSPVVPETIGMIGGGLGDFAPGEWTDDTTMAVSIAEAAAAGKDLRSPAGLDQITAGFARWFAGYPKDIGVSTGAVLSAAGARTGTPSGRQLAEVARARFDGGASAAGNGGLMRTAPVALAHLDDPSAAAAAAQTVSDLTHADPVSGEACLIWTLGIHHAIHHSDFTGVRSALVYLPADRAGYWSDLLDEAEAHEPAHFPNNGWVVSALQAAWSAIVRTEIPDDDPEAGTFPAQHLALAIEAAVRAGNDTDTVAAIAGSLLGARWGASAVPQTWREILHGWPGYRSDDLERLAVEAARHSLTRSAGSPQSAGTPLSGDRGRATGSAADPGSQQ